MSNITSEVILQKGKLPGGVEEKDSDNTYPLSGWLCSASRPQGTFPIRIASGAAVWRGAATSCEMKDLNRAAGFQVTGILGYSFLSGYTLALDYRRGRAAFIPQSERAIERKSSQKQDEKWPSAVSRE
ncbi:MAG: hypothetical protein QM757_45900 [Paludibaculum sp.]